MPHDSPSLLRRAYWSYGLPIVRQSLRLRYWFVYRRYRNYTMVPQRLYIDNLLLVHLHAPADGCIVECGVWRGGMGAGMAHALPGRVHYLFDSFEGLPPAASIDGDKALQWQQDTSSPYYYDNCRAELAWADSAMRQSPAKKYALVKGWFSETLTKPDIAEPIAVLRLDADWYESTIECLRRLYPLVRSGGIVIVDDYYVWDGCSRAVHEYLYETSATTRIRQSREGVCYFIKS